MVFDSSCQEILRDLDRLSIGYQIGIFSAPAKHWQPYFYELSLDSYRHDELFIPRDKLFANENNSLMLSGLALAKESQVKEIRLCNDAVCLNAKIDCPSPACGKRFPDVKHSSTARWKCAVALEDKARQTFDLIVLLENGREITFQKIEFRRVKFSDKHEAIKEQQNIRLARKLDAIQSSRQLMAKTITAEQNYLFAIGNARSGTTAVGKLLNYSSEICLGIERFANNDDVSAFSFLKQKFFDPESENYSVRPHFYEKIQAKFDTAKYIGDKRPRFINFWRNTWLNLPQAKIVYIFRNIYDVAYSYNKRAKNAALGIDDSWSNKRDFSQAVADWNQGLTEVVALADFYEVYWVKYEDFFVDRQKILHLLDYLQIDTAEPNVMQGIDKTIHDALALATKPRILSDSANKYIEANADFTAYDRLLALYNRQFS